eukprot:scaffold3065_cov389-Prasinococcus_capsulatus_cf.AAC.4
MQRHFCTSYATRTTDVMQHVYSWRKASCTGACSYAEARCPTEPNRRRSTGSSQRSLLSAATLSALRGTCTYGIALEGASRARLRWACSSWSSQAQPSHSLLLPVSASNTARTKRGHAPV